MGFDRTLDEEGVPDLDGPLPGKVMTGDPQEGTPPPSDRPAALDYGTTIEEESRPEPLDAKVRRERPDFGDDVEVMADEQSVVAVVPGDEDIEDVDDEAELVGRAVDQEGQGLSAEEAAVHVDPT